MNQYIQNYDRDGWITDCRGDPWLLLRDPRTGKFFSIQGRCRRVRACDWCRRREASTQTRRVAEALGDRDGPLHVAWLTKPQWAAARQQRSRSGEGEFVSVHLRGDERVMVLADRDLSPGSPHRFAPLDAPTALRVFEMAMRRPGYWERHASPRWRVKSRYEVVARAGRSRLDRAMRRAGLVEGQAYTVEKARAKKAALRRALDEDAM